MIQSPAADSRTEGDATATDGDTDPDGAAAGAALATATGMVMAMVPCTAGSARRVLGDAARAAGVTLRLMARTVVATRACPAEVDPDCERALRTAIGYARAPQPLSPPTEGTVLPAPDVLRRHLEHLRAVRRRTLAAPDDPALRAALEDAAYTLCVLMGQRHAHGALLAAEERVAAHRLPPSPPGSPSPSAPLPAVPASVPGGTA
ncbi:DUF5133 domain-containing protein [Streptomyces yangpuensis]|uniref:DUF5133 domain-containing protein n=1 Tax=Streptomyces yangpuensis TaxID=1648182 RepID=UPI0007C6BF5E|nr:DUF5133 domain-containing protein [Streptomyces yangpuensis]